MLHGIHLETPSKPVFERASYNTVYISANVAELYKHHIFCAIKKYNVWDVQMFIKKLQNGHGLIVDNRICLLTVFAQLRIYQPTYSYQFSIRIQSARCVQSHLSWILRSAVANLFDVTDQSQLVTAARRYFPAFFFHMFIIRLVILNTFKSGSGAQDNLHNSHAHQARERAAFAIGSSPPHSTHGIFFFLFIIFNE